ncbi:P-loop containing nucleoside triphosphate hydrolase protein [Imleria badia]|nr:P-loop containing nucleoside triphosphate hydrolase protein [Imleria badia]
MDQSNSIVLQTFLMASVNAVLLGETGVGKSAVVNLISGHQVASVSSDASGHTLSSRPFSIPIDGRTFHIWDTPGLDQPEMGAVGYMAAIEEHLTLIQQLSEQGGIDLVLFCIRGGPITVNTLRHYRLFYEVLYRSQVPIALVITHLEREPDMEAWWTRNQSSFETHGIKPAGHACVTGLPTHRKYPESKANIERLLRGYKREHVKSADSWSIKVLRLLGVSASPKKDKDLFSILTERCGLDPEIAKELAERLARK